MFEVFAQAPIPAQPAKGPFHHPAAWNHHKALSVRRAAGNLQPPPTVVLDPPHHSFIAPLGPDEFQATPPVVDPALDPHKEFLQEHFTARAVRPARPMHPHPYEQPQDSDHDVAFAPIDLLVHVRPTVFPAFRRLDALAVNNRGTGLGLPPFLLADGCDQGRVERVPQPAVAPSPVIPIPRLPRRKVVRQQAPGLPTAPEIEDGIENLAIRPGARAASGTPGQGEQVCKAAPLVIIQIRWVRSSGGCFPPPRLSAPFSKRSLRARYGDEFFCIGSLSSMTVFRTLLSEGHFRSAPAALAECPSSFEDKG